MGFKRKGIEICDIVWFIRSGRIVKGRVIAKRYGGEVYDSEIGQLLSRKIYCK